MKCPLISLFQKISSLFNTTSDQAFYVVFEQFETIITQLRSRLFQDPNNYLLSVFLVFYDKLCTSYQFSAELLQKDSSQSTVEGLLGLFFGISDYPDSRVKDVETSDYLKNRGSYRVLFNKFKGLEIRQALDNYTSPQLINQILALQITQDLISFCSHYKEKISEVCIQQIHKEIQEHEDAGYAKTYQLLKLSIQIMSRGEGAQGNKGFYEILHTGITWPRNSSSEEQKDNRAAINQSEFTWLLVENFKQSESFNRFWQLISYKVRQHLIAKIKLMKDKSMLQPSGTSSRLETLLPRMQGSQEDGMLNDNVFIIYKRLYLYGTLNLEMFNILYPSIKEILRDIKDFEYSFEIKIAIHQMLVICKDKEGEKHKDILKSLTSLLRYLYDYISQVDVKYGNQKPPPQLANNISGQSSSRRLIDGELSAWEQERIAKIKQIKSLVGQSISIIAKYIDFKEKRLSSNLAFLEVSEEAARSAQARPLDMMIARKDYFEMMLSQLKKIILRSHMHGGYLVEQFLRIFFYDRRELQNLCFIQKNDGNELLQDNFGKAIMEQTLGFIVESTEIMQGNAHSVVRSFVSQLYAKVVAPSSKQHLDLYKFSKSLNQQSIKQIKKIMIYIREREDQLKESCTQMKELMVKTLASNPNSIIYKEFLSFFREIFYYNKDMDQVDYELACDSLEIFNQLLKTSLSAQTKEVLAIKPNSEIFEMKDYFQFSDLSPGIILNESLRIPNQSFTISILYKMNISQIQAYQERTGKLDLQLTFFQILNKEDNSYAPMQILINVIKDRMKIFDYDVKLDENWHLLTVLFDYKSNKLTTKRNHKVKIFIDSLFKRINHDRDIYHVFSNKHQHILAYGVDAIDLVKQMPQGGAQHATGVAASTKLSLQVQGQQIVLNNEFKPSSIFYGCLSLPFIFKEFEVDNHSNESQKRPIQQFILECIMRKQQVGITNVDLANYLRWCGKLSGKENISNFESHDINEDIIIKHQSAVEIDHLGAIHRVLPHETVVVLGGFKMMYPLFERSMQSNLTFAQKAEIWRHIFRILRTLMNIEPSHILRLFKNKQLIQTLKSCLIKGGMSHKLLTKDLLNELLNIIRDVNSNKQATILSDFYKKYVFEILLDETFCDLYFIDVRKNRRNIIFEEVTECLSKMFAEEDSQRDRQNKTNRATSSAIQKKERKASGGETIDKLNTTQGNARETEGFFTPSNAKEIYKLFMNLIIRYQEAEYIKFTKKLASIMMKIILRDEQKENFTQLLECIQYNKDPSTTFRKQSLSSGQKTLSKATLLALLKIFEGVIKHPLFPQSSELIYVLKNHYRREAMDSLLNQYQQSYQAGYQPDEHYGKLEDEIIAITLRIIIDVQAKLSFGDQQKPVMPPRHLYVGSDKLTQSSQEERKYSISQLYSCITRNPRGIYLQKTLCSLIILAMEKKQKLRIRSAQGVNIIGGVGTALTPVKYNAQFLREILKDRDLNNVLDLLKVGNSEMFDHDLFSLTIKLFKWYDLETKKIFLDFYRQIIDDQTQSHNIEELQTFKDIKFLDNMKLLLDYNQETYLLNIVTNALKINEPNEVVRYAELIVSSFIKAFFNTSLQMDIEGIIYDEETKFLKAIKKLFIQLENHDNSLLAVICTVLKYVQEVVNWVWSYVLHDTNRTNLNLKLLLFIQLVEELFMKKIGQTDQNRVQSFLNNPLTYEVLARLMIVFEDTKIIYFDYPNPLIIDTNKRQTIATGIIRVNNSIALKEVSFTFGGPLRIFLTLLLSIIRKIKPIEGIESQNLTTFDIALELTRYYLFKEDSAFVSSFRPIPTIEPPTASGQSQAPLFKLVFNGSSTKRSLYVLQPIDLTKQYIEMHNDGNEQKDSIAQTLGFLPLILINEIHEIIKRKYAHLKAHEDLTDEFSVQLKHILILQRDVIFHSYVSEEIQESIGYVLLTITDPRIKEELYSCLNPQRLMKKGRLGASAKPYFISKACEFVDQIRQNTEIGTRQMGSEVEASNDNMLGKGLQTVMRDGHFRQSANPDQVDNLLRLGYQEINSPAEQRKIPESNHEDDEDAEEQFADLDPIKLIEDKERYDSTRDYGLYQEELILFMNKCYNLLKRLFSENQTPSGHNDFVWQFRDEFLVDNRVDEIMQAFRLISSEKFRHVHTYSFTNKEDQEIQKQLKHFQGKDLGRLTSIDKILQQNQITPAPNQQLSSTPNSARIQTKQGAGQASQNQNEISSSQSPDKPLRILDSDGALNFTPYMMESQTSKENPLGESITKNARKRSADDTDNNNLFEFQSSEPGNPISSQNGSQGKVSLASSSRPTNSVDHHLHASQVSLPNNTARSNGRHRTLEYYYGKQQYNKTVKKLMEEPSSIWYDNLEQMRKDYADMKEIYDIVNAAQQQPDQLDAISGGQCPLPGTEQNNLNKNTQPPNNTGYRPRQYDYFIRQRKATDLWGRCLLLKPDRKYKQRKFLISHKYFVHDMLKNLFAVSLLEDGDFPDYQIQLKEYLEKSEKQHEQPEPVDPNENPQSDNPIKKPTQSEQFKRLRELLLQKIEQNDFLYSLLTNPKEFMSEYDYDDDNFIFHPITSQCDPSIVWSGDVQYITVEGGHYGELYLSNNYLMFKSKNTRIPFAHKFAIHSEQVIKKKNKIWHIGSLEQIFKRRFALFHQAFEIFTKEKKNYFFNLLNEDQCSKFFTKVAGVVGKFNKQDKSKIGIQLIEKPKNEFKNKHYVEEWTKGEISTQEFLLLVNKYSGRTFNDFSQYPIFPWVVSDYNCSYQELVAKTDANKIQQIEESGFRDLTKNSGVLSEQKLEVAKTQYAADIDQNDLYGQEKYHLKFGTSNRLFCLGFLIRMEPFTDNFIKVNGNLDNPDRIFFSFKDQWKSLLDDKQNNSELIPEFFYFPELFRNHNLAYLGRSRSGHTVNEVELPAWAKNEHDFIRIHREMLESKVIQSKLRFWVDLTFGTRQMDESSHNVFYCYCYENFVRQRRDELDPANINMIMEFMQVPQQIFSEPLFKIDRKQLQLMQKAELQNIEEEQEEYDENSQYAEIVPQQTPAMGGGAGLRKPETRIVSANPGIKQMNKLTNKISSTSKVNAAMNSRSHMLEDPKSVAGGAGAQQDLRNSSLIQKFIECAASQNRSRHENEMKKIQESHKIDKPEEKNIFHMAFSQLNGRCFVFLADKETGSIKCVACRESFLQEELKNPCYLGLKIQNLRGDYNNIFQLYGGGMGDKAASQRSPLLFTCQNLDNSIKVFDLSIKKGQQLVHQERTHNNVVTSIKFSSDFKYFISGDLDGVIHHYQRNLDETAEDLNASTIQDLGGGRFQNIEGNSKRFPFSLKVKFQDQYRAIVAIDTNYTLDMYVTASRDGTLALRCLRSSSLWKLIALEKLSAPTAEVLTLKLSLHGYIILMMKESALVYTFVYSLNGDLLVSTKRESEQFEFKYAQLTNNEDNLILVFNQKPKKEDKDMQGVIRVSRLFDLEKEVKRDNLQKTFYPMIHQMIYPETASSKSVSKALSRRDQTGDLSMMSGLGGGGSSSKYVMPAVNSFALSQDESKMNLFLKTGEIICFDESRSQIIEQLDDFGLA